jgi:hypothetical protein
VKPGDLVKGRPAIAMSKSYGVVLDMYEDDDGTLYIEVQWFDGDRMWYDELELVIVNESR